MNHLRTILTTSAAAAVLAMAVPSGAHPSHDGKQEVVREVTIVNDGGDKKTTEIHVFNGGGVKAQASADADFAADCGKGRKFESSATADQNAKEKRVSKIVLCSDAGESDAEWAKTLRGALARIEGDQHMPADGKAKIMADLKSEIARTGK